MSGPFQTGQHPDADSLAAFLEGVLPEHERSACLAHFAECPRCREIAFIVQEPEPAPRPIPAWRRWLAPIPVLAGAAAACTIGAALWFYAHRPPERLAPPAPNIVAQKTPAPVQPPSELPRAVASVPTRRTPPPFVPPKGNRPQSAPSLRVDAPIVAANGAPPSELPLSVESTQPAPPVTAELSGTVTDPSGAAVPNADIAVRPAAGGAVTNARTDPNGKFQIASLPPGRYELHVQARGFQAEIRQLDLQPQRPTQVASVLNVGSTAETVEVTAEAATISELPLSGRATFDLTASTTSATIGQISLAASTDGRLHISHNSGKTWITVKTPWKDPITQLTKVNDPEQFQVTTRSGDLWLSRDGTHWRSTPAAPTKKN
jgi:hypothetical protein